MDHILWLMFVIAAFVAGFIAGAMEEHKWGEQQALQHYHHHPEEP